MVVARRALQASAAVAQLRSLGACHLTRQHPRELLRGVLDFQHVQRGDELVKLLQWCRRKTASAATTMTTTMNEVERALGVVNDGE